METINFVKMHGLGNDFVLIDGRKESLNQLEIKKLAQDICDRHFGVGADGLLIVWPSQKADVRMQVFNSDGSEPEMCGNGIRCFAKYVYESSTEKKEVLSVETKAGIIVPALIIDGGLVVGAEVNMGTPRDEGEISLHGHAFRKINMGNPHAVALVENFEAGWAETGRKVETDAHFPEGTNVEFAKVINQKEIEVKVWERGAGETLACGTGACAAATAAILAGKISRDVVVKMPGGNLEVEWEAGGNILLRGPAEKVFEGRYFI